MMERALHTSFAVSGPGSENDGRGSPRSSSRPSAIARVNEYIPGRCVVALVGLQRVGRDTLRELPLIRLARSIAPGGSACRPNFRAQQFNSGIRRKQEYEKW
jgi:hypothetical protein